MMWTDEGLAKFFHETYEALAPSFGYETREQTRVEWADVPDNNKALMVAVAGQVLDAMREDGVLSEGTETDDILVDVGSTPSVVVNNNFALSHEQIDAVASRMTDEFWARLRDEKR